MLKYITKQQNKLGFFLNKFSFVSNVFLIINFFIVTHFIRIDDILGIKYCHFFIEKMLYIGMVFAFFSALFSYFRLTLTLLILLLAIRVHAYACFYYPSLSFDIMNLNYTLTDRYYSGDIYEWALIYLSHVSYFIFAFITLYASLKEGKNRGIAKTFLFVFLFSFMTNLIVDFIQKFYSFKFLTQNTHDSVPLGRSPALLEDSGIAGCYFAACFSIFFLAACFANIKNSKKMILFFCIFVLYFFVGITSGRVFYLSTALVVTLVFLVLFYRLLFLLIRSVLQVRIAVVFSLLLSIAAIFLVLKNGDVLCNYSDSCSRIVKESDEFKTAFANPNADFLTVIENLDWNRTCHVKVMLQAVQKHFWTGTGIGSFPVNFFDYQPKQIWKNLYFDHPFYLMLASELGIVGILLCCFFLLLLCFSTISYFFFLNKKQGNRRQLFITKTIPIGIGISLATSFLISTLFFFPLASALACYAFVFLLLPFFDKFKFVRGFVLAFFLACALYLFAVVAFMALHVPRVPEFRWQERGIPQVAREVLVPKEYAEKIPSSKQPGRWMEPKTELLLFHNAISIYVDQKKKSFPLTITLTFHNQKNEVFEKQKIKIEESKWVDIVSQQAVTQKCFENISFNNYCSVNINIDLPWREKKKRIGFYIEDKNVFFSTQGR